MSFAEIAGQQNTIQALQKSLDRGRLGHAYLFAGNELAELEKIARTLTKTLNCLHPSISPKSQLPVDCCDQCLSCRKIDEANHPDATWVRPESKSRVITVDQIRDLMHLIHLKPTEAKYKVGVIVAADRLNTQAANAFLKTLEEPPARSILLLLTTEPDRVLETIRSRCLRLSFQVEGIPSNDTRQVSWISQFAQTAASAGEGMLARYNLLGNLLGRLSEMKKSIEQTLAAQSPLERYEDVERTLQEKWEDELAAAVEAEYRRQRAQLLLLVEWWLRDVWLLTLRAEKQPLSFPDIAGQSQAVSRRISPEEATGNLRMIEALQRLLGSNVQEALALEVSLLKLKL